jgi:hypothetical protein
MGVSQVEQAEGTPGSPASTARTRPRDLLEIVRQDPRMAPRVAVFLGVTLVARLRARNAVRRRGYSDWLRDESSRNG